MRCFGLIGKSLKHSFSKDFFDKKFESEGIEDCSYDLYSLESIDSLPALIKDKSLNGLNVTIPFKQSVIPYLDFIDEHVQQIGAVNCIKVSGEELFGFNTDWIAFKETIEKLIKSDDKALILGSGGSSKAVQYAFRSLEIEMEIVSRNPLEGMFDYSLLTDKIINSHRIIVNTTPLGMFPDTDNYPEIPYDGITENHLIYDLIYNPDMTLFLQKAHQKGASIVNGLSMLYSQAEKSWEIWTKP